MPFRWEKGGGVEPPNMTTTATVPQTHPIDLDNNNGHPLSALVHLDSHARRVEHPFPTVVRLDFHARRVGHPSPAVVLLVLDAKRVGDPFSALVRLVSNGRPLLCRRFNTSGLPLSCSCRLIGGRFNTSPPAFSQFRWGVGEVFPPPVPLLHSCCFVGGRCSPPPVLLPCPWRGGSTPPPRCVYISNYRMNIIYYLVHEPVRVNWPLGSTGSLTRRGGKPVPVVAGAGFCG